jgi:hypothetical protein
LNRSGIELDNGAEFSRRSEGANPLRLGFTQRRFSGFDLPDRNLVSGFAV